MIPGFATVNGYPFYLVAQNFKVLSGGVSKANCDKIAKCLDAAEKNATPVIYLLNTLGVQVGEGVTVLEGLGKLLMRGTQLKGVVPQYAIVNGEVYGSSHARRASGFLFLPGKEKRFGSQQSVGAFRKVGEESSQGRSRRSQSIG